ncbi:hypothetical protein BDW59DRAFT_163434 [Aspergillus cavernicola]|uniref:P-loop containing nucleoside triphosphate hydrolase protein n=1 Tax=Aspergillus cavernicola TaxID=176166 RepID=A0ABR4I6K8_9EURO
MSVDAIKCVLVGNHTVGKTSLLMSYISKVFSSTDVLVILEPCTDTTNEQDYTRQSFLAYIQADIFFLCFSIASPESFDHVCENWLPKVRHTCPKVPCIVGTESTYEMILLQNTTRRRGRITPVANVTEGTAPDAPLALQETTIESAAPSTPSSAIPTEPEQSPPIDRVPSGSSPLPKEKKEVSNIITLIRQRDFAQAKLTLTVHLNSNLFSVPSKIILAEALYRAGRLSQVIKLLQIPLIILQSDPIAGGTVNHILAKAYFADDIYGKAIEYCETSLAMRSKSPGVDHPSYLESAELKAQILRADGRDGEADTLQMSVFPSRQHQFLHLQDQLESFFESSKELGRDIMTTLLVELIPEDSDEVDRLLKR